MSKLLASYHGLVPYEDCLEIQAKSHEMVSDGASDVLLMMQHPHVFTLGRRGRKEDVLISREKMLELGIEAFDTERGGEVTYHGPGQLIVYPIINLRRLGGIGPTEYVRKLEQSISQFLALYDIEVNTDKKPTGVWIGDHKIASIGVRISKGTTTHGFSLNISNDLSYFEHIIACGIPESKNTSLSSHIGTPVLIEDTLQPIAKLITEKFHYDLDWKKYPSSF